MEARVVELPVTRVIDRERVIPKTIVRPKSRDEAPVREDTGTRTTIAPILRFERVISFAIIVFALMTLSSVSLQSLLSNIDARESRITIQEVRTEIGNLREELQQARAGLENSNAPESVGTLPLDPGDVITVKLPPGIR
jgi:cell division protein FtsL